jgi:hypothetical protein
MSWTRSQGEYRDLLSFANLNGRNRAEGGERRRKYLTECKGVAMVFCVSSEKECKYTVFR